MNNELTFSINNLTILPLTTTSNTVFPMQNCYKINENVKKYTFQGKSML